MKNLFLITLLFCFQINYAHAPFWGKTGHRATAEIAETYLSPQAKAAIDDLLDGEGLALVSNYGDDIKSDKAYDEYKVWHYLDIPQGKRYEDIPNHSESNIITALAECKVGLKNPDTPKEKKQFYLKMLIHLIGDLHQPLHVGNSEDKGGNTIKVFWFGEQSNLHRVWDENLLDSYQMSYTELAANQKKLTYNQIKEIEKGTPIDWLNDTKVITDKIYPEIKNQDYLGYNYMYDWMPVIREQLQKGGIRLAKELNELFD